MSKTREVLLGALILVLVAMVALRSRLAYSACVDVRSLVISYYAPVQYLVPPDDGFLTYPPLCMNVFEQKQSQGA
jgi:hypothetical protein